MAERKGGGLLDAISSVVRKVAGTHETTKAQDPAAAAASGSTLKTERAASGSSEVHAKDTAARVKVEGTTGDDKVKKAAEHLPEGLLLALATSVSIAGSPRGVDPLPVLPQHVLDLAKEAATQRVSRGAYADVGELLTQSAGMGGVVLVPDMHSSS